MNFSSLMSCLCFLFHPPIALTRSADSASMFGDLGDKDRVSLGLSHTDLEELMEVSQAAIGDEDVRRLEEVMMMMTEEEMEKLTSMSDEDLEEFYNEKLRKHDKVSKERNEDSRNILFRIGDELVELEGLSNEDMRSIMSTSDKLITKEELNNLKDFTKRMSEEDLNLITSMTDEELEHFYQDNIAMKNQRHRRETDEDDFLSRTEPKGFEEDSLRISQSKVKREAYPEPASEPVDPSYEDSQPSVTATKEENFLNEYVKRFR